MKTVKSIFLATALLVCAFLPLAAQMFVNPMAIPDTLSGPVYNLTVDESYVQFIAGDSTVTKGVNGPYLGPTLMMNKGDFVTLNVTNNLVDTTTMHWHGMHVAPADDGGPHTTIAPGTTWSPDFTVLDEATLFWYHPHMHHHTAEQVYAGAAGLIFLRDSNEMALNLPHTYGVDEFPLIIQDKTFDTDNQLIFAAMNDTVMVNGTLAPYLEVPAQMVRFRILNASNQRVYNLGWPLNADVYQIGGDGGLLNTPLPITRMLISPGERADVIVDFSGMVTSTPPLMSNASEMDFGVSGGPNGPGGGPGNPLDGSDFPILEFRVVAPTANPVTSIPATLNSLMPIPEAAADLYRTKVFTVDTSGFPFYINDEVFDMSVINDTIMLGDTEVWEIRNETDVAHPLHIHDVQFFMLDVNGNPPPPHLRGKKDVILLLPNDTVRFIARFDDFADPHVPYMYHCHNLFHEDGGMMGQFIVLDTVATHAGEAVESGLGSFSAYPNPSSGRFTLHGTDLKPGFRASLVLRDLRGQAVWQGQMQGAEAAIDLGAVAPGLYLLEVIGDDGQRGSLRLLRQD